MTQRTEEADVTGAAADPTTVVSAGVALGTGRFAERLAAGQTATEDVLQGGVPVRRRKDRSVRMTLKVGDRGASATG